VTRSALPPPTTRGSTALRTIVALACLVPGAGSARAAGGQPLSAQEAEQAGAPPAVNGAPLRSTTVLSEIYTVDRKYRSMAGPSSLLVVTLGDALPPPEGAVARPPFLHPVPEPELLWVTGYRAVVVGADGETPASQEFMCHSNLDIGMEQHRELFDLSAKASDRLFTLSQGQQEIRFPEGFGIPIRSDEPLRLATQVLNLNLDGLSLEVRHKVTIEFVRDAETARPMRALYQVAANGLVLLEGKDGYYAIPEPDAGRHGEGCLAGTPAQPAGHVYEDDQGRRFSGHWVVPPGRQVNRTNATRFMGLRFDTRAHYIAVHLHPFAESLELRDLTADEVIFFSRATPSEGIIGLDHVEHFASAEGIPLYEDHEYELISVYENTSGEEQDSMAVMYIYVEDREFDREKAIAEGGGTAPESRRSAGGGSS
jgi:hypothetical protein